MYSATAKPWTQRSWNRDRTSTEVPTGIGVSDRSMSTRSTARGRERVGLDRAADDDRRGRGRLREPQHHLAQQELDRVELLAPVAPIGLEPFRDLLERVGDAMQRAEQLGFTLRGAGFEHLVVGHDFAAQLRERGRELAAHVLELAVQHRFQRRPTPVGDAAHHR